MHFDPGVSDIRAAYERISGHIRRTPVIEVDAADFGFAGQQLTLKLELLQHSGSFKARGAFTHLLGAEVPAVGVTAASGGNHGAAVAYAAGKLGVPAKIFVPSVAAQSKIDRIRATGADLVIAGDRYADALAASQEHVAKSGALPIHAYDQPATLLGQATVGLEFEEQAPEVDTILVAVGGGGLIGGMASWYRGRKKLIAIEPASAPTYAEALKAGQPVDTDVGGIAVDSLGARRIGSLMFPLASQYVAASVLVADEAIREAQKLLWKQLRIVAEPGGATALAALISGAYKPEAGERVGLLVCGGNPMVEPSF
ncbi:threonine/serine dehydratase [Lacibacterium aquatile]|uniref:Threonine/serine dehydratase n=1 Tax=Lacibacterium aquatile TaxID=1168082 RepID=A0ABW5DRI2_9PROT